MCVGVCVCGRVCMCVCVSVCACIVGGCGSSLIQDLNEVCGE